MMAYYWDEEAREWKPKRGHNAVLELMREKSALEAENSRLRALLPDAETVDAIHDCALDSRQFHRGMYTKNIIAVRRWLRTIGKISNEDR